MNNDIRARTVLLIDQNFKANDNNPANKDKRELSEISTQEALQLAISQELDLVIVNEKSNPPIAKIMDYGKHIYELKRKSRENKKKASFIKVKSINVKPQISDHDLEWKSKQAIEWLSNGDRVQFVIKAYGRIATKVDLIRQTYEKFVKLLENDSTIQSELRRISGVQYEAFFAPNKKK